MQRRIGLTTAGKFLVMFLYREMLIGRDFRSSRPFPVRRADFHALFSSTKTERWILAFMSLVTLLLFCMYQFLQL